jgi:CBS domain containing-hemolysin-like protein
VSDSISLRKYLGEDDDRKHKRIKSALKETYLLVRSAIFTKITFFLVSFIFMAAMTDIHNLILTSRFYIPLLVYFAYIYIAGFAIPTLVTGFRNPKFVVFLLSYISLAHKIVKPILSPINYIMGLIKFEELSPETQSENERSEHARAYIEDGKAKGFFVSDEEELLHSVVEFTDTILKEVMTPRVDMVYVHKNTPIDDMVKLIKEHNHSRYPVYDKNIDDIVGVLNIQELFSFWGSKKKENTIKNLYTKPHFVPETKRVGDLLKEMQGNHLQMCIVVDEYGGTAGLATIEDLLEELVGEIQDEYEEPETDIVKNPDGTYTVLGKMDIDELEEFLQVPLDDESYESVAGMIFSELGRVPKPEETITVRGLHITIEEVNGRKIERVRVRLENEQV